MPKESFNASVQYNDWKGTCAADGADSTDAQDWLREKGHMVPGDFLLGIRCSIGENHGKHKDPVYVEFLIIESSDYDSVQDKLRNAGRTIEVKHVQENMGIADFLALFKRFEVALSRDAALDNMEFTYYD